MMTVGGGRWSWVRRALGLLVLLASWVFLLGSGLLLWAAVSYYRDIPVLYEFYAQDRLEDKLFGGLLWIVLQGALFLLAALLCFAVTRRAWRKRRSGKRMDKTE